MPDEAILAHLVQRVLIDGQEVEYRLVRSRAAKRIRIKVMPDGIDVIVPEGRDIQEAATFVAANQAWVSEQLKRARHLRIVKRPQKYAHGQILFRGQPTLVETARSDCWKAPNKVLLQDGRISITCGSESRTPVERSLENWLRKHAREIVRQCVAEVAQRIRRAPNRIYIMDQRTKWGNCSALGNLSFNWRLIMAPEYVFEYIVTHEMVHLAVPDHSQRFWFTVYSLCRDADRARQWLVRNSPALFEDISINPGS